MADFIKFSELSTNKKNPRKISKANKEKLIESIKRDPEYMEKRCIVIADGVILAGNQRYLAAKETLKDSDFRNKIGVPEGYLPASWVVDVSDWPKEKKERFILIDNITLGEWDVDMLISNYGRSELIDLGINEKILFSSLHNEEYQIDVPVKDPNIIVRLSFHPGLWLGKRDEIMAILEKLKKTYDCKYEVNE